MKKYPFVITIVFAFGLILAIYWWHSSFVQPIRIGVLHSLTGTMAMSEKPLVDAVQLAVEEINAQGGLLGRPVEMVVADGRSDEKVFAEQAERLIVEEKVSVLFACWTSACRRAVKPVVEGHNQLMFYPIQYEGLEQSPNIVYMGSTPNQQIIPGTRWAFDTFGKRVYLVGSDYFFPRAANRIIRDLAQAASATVLGERYLALGSREVAPIIEEIRRLKPDVILNTLNGDSNLPFFTALHESFQGNVPVMSFSLAEGELAAMGKQAYLPEHYAVWGYFQNLPGEQNQRFVAAFQQRFGKSRVTSDPIESAYDGVKLWANAVREADSAEPERVNRNILRQSVAGPAGVVALDPLTRHVWKWVRIGRARPDGQFEQVYASDTALRPVPFPSYRTLVQWRDIAAEIANAKGERP